LRNEYLVTENRMLRHRIKGRIRVSDGEPKTLAELGPDEAGVKRVPLPPRSPNVNAYAEGWVSSVRKALST
jgi:hypothetical protein